MTQRPSLLFFLPMVLVAVALGAWWAWRPPGAVEVPVTLEEAGGSRRMEAALFFPDLQGRRMVLERRELLLEEGAEPLDRLWQALVAGPRVDGAAALELDPAALLFHQGGELVLRPERPLAPPPSGAWQEALRKGCIIMTFLESVPELRRVRILPPRIGMEADHLDLDAPIGRDEIGGWGLQPAGWRESE